MTFINEYIPKEDLEKYNFEELNKRRKKTSGTTPARDWTIDRKANIWLRQFYIESDHTAPDGGYTGFSYWDFYWKDTLMFLKLKSIESGRISKGHKWSRKKLISINIPDKLEDQRDQIIKDIECAFVGHKGSGIFAKCSDYTFILEL